MQRRRRKYYLNAYSQWDGTQAGFDVTAQDILDSISDDLMASQDISRALRRLMEKGFQTRSGDWVKGMQELRERMRERRQELLDSHNLNSIYSDIQENLDEIVSQEQKTLDAMEQAEAGDPDQLQDKRDRLEGLPENLLEKIQELTDYDFASEQASAQFEELMEKLRSQLMDAYMNRIMESAATMDMQRMKDMLDALNQMIEERAEGGEPDFESFMEDFGDMFGDNPPENLDQLLEMLAQSMAQMNAMMNSMSPEQRAQLQQLAEQLLGDMDLDWQVSRLSANLQNIFGPLDWEQAQQFRGDQALDLSSGAEMFDQLADIQAMEDQLANSTRPADINEIDVEKARELLGAEDANNLKQLAELARQLEEAGFVTPKDGAMQLSPKAINHIGKKVLGDIMQRLEMGRVGEHDMHNTGQGHEIEFETKTYEWGDPFNLNIQQTIRNAVTRRGSQKGSKLPVKIQPEDFEVDRTQQKVENATVLMLDLSLSMEMRNNFVSAKKVAIALHSLIGSKYPRDFLGIVGFSWAAKEIDASELVEVGVDWLDHGTNMEHGFKLSRSMLANRSGSRQIIMITDGEPTAHLGRNGIPEFYYPPVPETINKTLAETMRVTKDGIVINVFMLDAYPGLKRFIEHLTRLNGGRAFYTTPETLGEYVISDFVGKRA